MKVSQIINKEDFEKSTWEVCEEGELEDDEPYYEKIQQEREDENSRKRPKLLDYPKNDIIVFREYTIIPHNIQDKLKECELIQVSFFIFLINYTFYFDFSLFYWKMMNLSLSDFPLNTFLLMLEITLRSTKNLLKPKRNSNIK